MRNVLCKFILSAGLAASPFVILAQTPPTIITQPISQTVACHSNVTFSVTAGGAETLHYLWTADGQPLAWPATNASLTLTNVLFGSGTKFTVVVTNSLGMVASEPAILTVTNPPAPALSITKEGLTNLVSWPHTCGPFTLRSIPDFDAVTNGNAITNWKPVEAVLTVSDDTNSVDVGNSGMSFYWLATILPIITTPPESLTTAVGSTVTFSVSATSLTNTLPLSYQWRLNGIILTNATNAILSLTNVQRRDAGSYDVVVANTWNATVSQIATLKVTGVPLTLEDDFADRVTTNNVSNAIDGNNVGATKELPEPAHAGILGGKSVWLQWVAPTNGIATFDTQGSAFDTVLGVYKGTTVDTLTLVTSDDDSGGFYTSRVQFNAFAGTQYQIAIDGLAGSSGDISLNWNLEVTTDEIPQIKTPPQSQTALTNSSATFTVVVDSSLLPLTYQWKFSTDGFQTSTDIGTSSNSLLITNAQLANVGGYKVVVSNTNRSVESTAAYLDLQLEPTGTNAIPFNPEKRFKDKLEVRFDSPPSGQSLVNLAKPKPRPKLQSISVAAGSTYSTSSYSLTQGWDPTVCYYPVIGTLYANVVPSANGTLTISVSPSANTILKVRLPNGAAPWTFGSPISVTGVVAGWNYPVTIGMRSGSSPGTIFVALSNPPG